MKDYSFIKNKFIEKHKIDDIEYLEKYIQLMIEYKSQIDEMEEDLKDNKFLLNCKIKTI